VTASKPYYLAEGLPVPVPESHGLSAPFWEGLQHGQLRVQHCHACGRWQFGPQWLCHECHSFDLAWEPVAATGTIYSWARVWHPVHPSLKDQGPYLVVLVELAHAGCVRMLGNLLGDPMQDVVIGTRVDGQFEDHPDGEPPFSLLQWQVRPS